MPDGDPAYQTVIFDKPIIIEEAPIAAEDETALEAEGTDETETFNFCNEVDQNPEELPFFFEACEDIAPGVGSFSFSKYDTTSFTVNSNGTVTYNLEASTGPVSDDFNNELENNKGDDEMPFDMDPASMGFVVDYVLVSPWPILDHSAGTLEDEYTLRVNLIEETGTQSLTVTLDTDGSTIELLAPKVQVQIDNLIASLKEKLTVSDAPVERQIEYIYHLSNKIQRLAAIRPDQQVPLGYLQTKLIALGEELEFATFEALDQEFLSELDAITEEAIDATDEDVDEEDIEDEDINQTEENLDLNTNDTDEVAETSDIDVSFEENEDIDDEEDDLELIETEALQEIESDQLETLESDFEDITDDINEEENINDEDENIDSPIITE